MATKAEIVTQLNTYITRRETLDSRNLLLQTKKARLLELQNYVEPEFIPKFDEEGNQINEPKSQAQLDQELAERQAEINTLTTNIPTWQTQYDTAVTNLNNSIPATVRDLLPSKNGLRIGAEFDVFFAYIYFIIKNAL
jgi:hypothetical protein